MKYEELINNDVLQNASCRAFVSDLWNNKQSDLYLGFFPKTNNLVTDIPEDFSAYLEAFEITKSTDLFQDDDKNNRCLLISYLLKNKIIDLLKINYYPKEEFGIGAGADIYLICSLKNKDLLKLLFIRFSSSTIDEPLGKLKQEKILKDLLKNKFIKLENRELKFKWENVPVRYQNHFNVIQAITYLENEGLISSSILELDLDVKKDILGHDGRHDTVSYKYGRIKIDVCITITEKLMSQWASESMIDSDIPSFDSNTGKLKVNGEYIDFCTPNTIVASIMNVLIDNLNSIVPHAELAPISWGVSKEEIASKYKKDGKAIVHERNKIRIKEIRSKIENNTRLSKIFSLKTDNGYGLMYTRTNFNTEDLAYKLMMNDIPF